MDLQVVVAAARPLIEAGILFTASHNNIKDPETGSEQSVADGNRMYNEDRIKIQPSSQFRRQVQ